MTASRLTPSASWSSQGCARNAVLRGSNSRLPHFALNGSSGWTHNIEAPAAPGHHLDPSNQNGKDSPKKFALTSKGVPNGRHKWTEREHARDRACRVEPAECERFYRPGKDYCRRAAKALRR